MEIGNQILFFLAGLGVFNGLLLAFYFLFWLKPRKIVHLLFGFLMLMLCVRIGKSLFHIFTDVDRIYRQIGLSACMMIGPFLYLYLQHFIESRKWSKLDSFHLFLPLFSILTIGIIWPYETEPQIWNTIIVKLIYGTWILYMLLSLKVVFPFFQKIRSRSLDIKELWLLLVYTCILLLCIAYNIALVGFPYLAAPLLFSIVLYLLLGFLFSRKLRAAVLEDRPVKYQKQKVSDAKAEALLNRLTAMMTNEKKYLDQKVKLAQIAGLVDSTPHEVSQVINDRLGISFNQYINEFRIKDACKMLKEDHHLTVEGIGQEVGFSSRSSFYTAFKNVMKQTPGQYKAEV